jgi:hypothetical protein
VATSPQSSTDAISIPKSALRSAGFAVGAVIVLVILVVLAIAAYRAVSGPGLPSAVNSNDYQAVFLTNGQVFFGKLSAGDGGDYYLRHVYLLLSAVTSKGSPGRQTLVKITREIHTPEDLMIIERRQVLYVENLNPSGRAAKLLASSG